MDDSRVVPSSPAEAEEFFAAGEDARSAASGSSGPKTIQHIRIEAESAATDAVAAPSCCVGIDVPEVGGVVHSARCPREGSPVRSGRDYVVGEVPEPLRGLVGGESFDSARMAPARERLLTQLLFAARDLAEGRIDTDVDHVCAVCAECGRESLGGYIPHRTHCRVGRLMRILADLCVASALDPNRKEAVPDGETGRAGDGIRPRGVPLTEAASALRQVALEEMVQLGTRPTWQCNVCGSSVTGMGKTERDIVHGCDCWVGNALVVLSSKQTKAPTSSVLYLAAAISKRATEIYEVGDTSALADAKDLVRALARVLCGESLESAFGSPGDWGYESEIGKALFDVYRQKGGAQ